MRRNVNSVVKLILYEVLTRKTDQTVQSARIHPLLYLGSLSFTTLEQQNYDNPN